jgi:hypothetical protein
MWGRSMGPEQEEQTTADKPFTFEISLSVLDHLGRNLYRSFATVLGEAISNAWDADANNVWIVIDRETNSFFIKDDGNGMNSEDFQRKFLKIGYTKRKDGSHSLGGRPFIGRKGIGKLALLSCADKISIISKRAGGSYVGGVIDNSGLDKAIIHDLTPDEYPLGGMNTAIFEEQIKDHKKGTILHFENIKDGIRNREAYLRKIIALYFRFSLLDKSFTIFLNDQKISLDDLKDLAQKTQFLWVINNLKDPYIDEKLDKLLKPAKAIKMKGNIKGFIASVEKPRNLKITTTDEKVTIDLFVNGRLREKDIIRHIRTERLVESYLYGQIHVDDLDDKKDRFTSSREGIVADDPKFKAFLKELKGILQGIFDDWDDWRREKKKHGDPENPRLTRKERSSIELYNAVSEEYTTQKPDQTPENRKKIEDWVDALSNDAKYNFTSYAECFISENLIRNYIREEKITLTPEAHREIELYKGSEVTHKNKGNISIELRQGSDDLTYLDMDDLANLVDKTGTQNDLANDSKQYRPIRDALMHTALLTDEAKHKLTTVYENIKGRLISLLSISKK